MVGMDPERAARELAKADQQLRRGAALVLLPRWWQPAGGLFFVLLWARWDVPEPARRWYALLLLVVIAGLVVGMVRLRRNARARPLRMKSGWRTWVLIWIVAITSCGVVLGSGLTLRSLAVPLPITVSSIVVVSALMLMKWSGQRWGGSYLQRVSRGQW
ncbi:hypothetical protein ABNF97_04375 [Plantactinospora sp. B6F1]|uniref:hypothetical protein n=1 Tax=Plantactinospora sp. B6F1 TaxID=3158971 RepID=UPI00102B711F